MRRERVLAQLFVQVFQESFFDTLRTKEQLGYVVTHQLREKAGSIGLRFLVQSERDPFYLDDRIEWFIGEQVPQIMSNLSDVEFARHQASLVHALLAKKKKLTEESLSYWTQILPKHYEFERAQVDAQMANSLTLADLRDFIQQYVLPTAPLRRRLAIHVWSNQFTPFAHRYTNGEWTRGELIEDPSDFCASMELFPVTYDRHLPSKVGLQI